MWDRTRKGIGPVTKRSASPTLLIDMQVRVITFRRFRYAKNAKFGSFVYVVKDRE